MSDERPVIPEEIDDLYEGALRYTEIHPDATGVACVVYENDRDIHLAAVAVVIEDPHGRPITPRRLAALKGRDQIQAREWAAVRVCMQAHVELARAVADRSKP